MNHISWNGIIFNLEYASYYKNIIYNKYNVSTAMVAMHVVSLTILCNYNVINNINI